MSLQFGLLAVLAIGAVTAAPASSFSTSISSQETCITRMRLGSTTPASLPTSTRTSAQTVVSTVTSSGSVTEVTETAFADAITSTTYVNATSGGSSVNAEAVQTSTVFSTVTPTNGTSGASCQSTTTLAADATSTVYTGTYSSPIAKRTVGVPVLPSGPPSLASIMSHVFGQSAVAAGVKPFEVDCLEQVTTFLLAKSTASASATTTTVTSSAPAVYVTSTNAPSTAAQASAPQSVVTITSTITAQASSNGTSGGVCTATTGKAAATTTQHIKCAPTNLISSVDGYGIGSTQGNANGTQGLAPGGDPSACCQLCMDTADCAAVEDDPAAGNCFLWYTTSPTCGLGFEYAKGSSDLAAGAGFLVQSGCGTIAAAAS
ncbi:hypothetical protein LTR08_001743 [Meristemomyces frigidus]|nr:hypothetical protein LTR08_001743 [Meristemomyces frigidus]